MRNHRKIVGALAIVAGLALAASTGFAQVIVGGMVAAPTSLDTGVDLDGDGTNDTVNGELCPPANQDPTLGQCLGTDIPCIFTGAMDGSDFSYIPGQTCGAFGSICVLNASDGPTAAEVPADKPLRVGKCLLINGSRAIGVFVFEDRDGGVDTDNNGDPRNPTGTCADAFFASQYAPGTHNGITDACFNDRSCDRVLSCLGGDNDGLPCDEEADCADGGGRCGDICFNSPSNDGGPCDPANGVTSNPDCGGGGFCLEDHPLAFGSFGPCLSGDEYWMQIDFLAGINRNNGDEDGDGTTDHQACTADCAASFDLGGGRNCLVGTCSGGARDGLACDALSAFVPAGCPGGTCTIGSYGGNESDPEVADEFFFTAAGISIGIHCPAALGLNFPTEVQRGVGVVVASLEILGVGVPASIPVELKGCYLHDQAGDVTTPFASGGEMAHIATLGTVVPDGNNDQTAYKNVCPNRTTVVHESTLGSAVPVPISPVLATIGSSTRALCGPLGRDRPCRTGQVCCGGTCVDGATCPGF